MTTSIPSYARKTMCPPDASQGCKIVPETLTANQMLVKAARLSQKPLQQMLDNSATSIANTDTDKDGLVSRGSFSKFIDMAASILEMYGYAPTDAELYENEDEKEQARREMFDSMDVQGTGVITVDEWLKFCVEHIIAKAATLAAHPILVHESMEVFKAFVNAALVIGSPEHMEMYWFLLELFTKSDPDKDGIVMLTDFSVMVAKALESPTISSFSMFSRDMEAKGESKEEEKEEKEPRNTATPYIYTVPRIKTSSHVL